MSIWNIFLNFFSKEFSIIFSNFYDLFKKTTSIFLDYLTLQKLFHGRWNMKTLVKSQNGKENVFFSFQNQNFCNLKIIHSNDFRKKWFHYIPDKNDHSNILVSRGSERKLSHVLDYLEILEVLNVNNSLNNFLKLFPRNQIQNLGHLWPFKVKTNVFWLSGFFIFAFQKEVFEGGVKKKDEKQQKGKTDMIKCLRFRPYFLEDSFGPSSTNDDS